MVCEEDLLICEDRLIDDVKSKDYDEEAENGKEKNRNETVVGVIFYYYY